MSRISKLIPSFSGLSKDCRISVRMTILQGVHQMVERIYAEGSLKLEVIPYSGTLSIALLSPIETQRC
jgi:hypothetical protein